MFERFKSYLSNFRSIFRGSTWRQIPPCEVLLFCHDVDRYVRTKNGAYSAILDSLADANLVSKGMSCVRVATPYSHLIGARAWGTSYHFNGRMLLYKWGIFRLLKFFTLQDVYSAVIKRSKCKLVMAIDANSALSLACHNSGVACVEVSHAMGYTDFSYKYKSSDPELLPDALICYDDTTAQAWTKLTGNPQSVIKTSHPWFVRFMSDGDRAGIKLPSELVNKAKEYSRVVIVTLQWGYDGEIEEFKNIIQDGFLSQEIRDAIQHTEESVLWILKLHPVQGTLERYSNHRKLLKCLETNFHNVYTAGNDLPLPLLLTLAHGHVTMISMACYEAAWLGVPSLTLCPTLLKGGHYQDYFEDLLKSGYVEKAPLKLTALLLWLEKLELNKKKPYMQLFNNTEIAETMQSLIAAQKQKRK